MLESRVGWFIAVRSAPTMVTMVGSGLIFIIILIIAGLVAAPGCDRQPAGAALKAGLPPLPPADTRALEPAVREQFRVAREALAASPTSPEANGALGRLFHAYNWLEHAQACYRRAAILEPGAFRWWYCLGRALMETGQRDEGIDTLRRAIALKDDYAPAALFLGEQALQDNDLEGARRWIALASKRSLRSPHALNALGQVAFKEGKINEAIQRYKEALDLAPRFGRAWYSLALAYRAGGDIESAERCLEKHSSSDKTFPPPDPILEEIQALRRDADHFFRSANKLLEEKSYAEAVRRYQEVLEMNPGLAMAEYNIGLALQYMGEHEKAAAHYDAFLRLRPNSIDALNNLGLCFFETDRPREAIEYFRKAVDIDSSYAKGHFNLGLASMKTGQMKEAMDHFRTALSLRPRDAEAHWNLGLLLMQAGSREEAMSHFLQVLEIRPEDERAQHQLLQDLRLALEAQASDPQKSSVKPGAARQLLVDLLKKKGLFKAAASVLERSLRLQGDDWRTAVELAWLLATCPDPALQKPGEAVRLVEPLCRQAAREDPRAFDALGAAHAAAGRFEEAARAAEMALRLAEGGFPGKEPLAAGIRARLKLYRERKPYHEP